jgi:hypothetical protein
MGRSFVKFNVTTALAVKGNNLVTSQIASFCQMDGVNPKTRELSQTFASLHVSTAFGTFLNFIFTHGLAPFTRMSSLLLLE